MPPESGGICGRLTYDLPLGCLQGGSGGGGGEEPGSRHHFLEPNPLLDPLVTQRRERALSKELGYLHRPRHLPQLFIVHLRGRQAPRSRRSVPRHRSKRSALSPPARSKHCAPLRHNRARPSSQDIRALPYAATCRSCPPSRRQPSRHEHARISAQGREADRIEAGP